MYPPSPPCPRLPPPPLRPAPPPPPPPLEISPELITVQILQRVLQVRPMSPKCYTALHECKKIDGLLKTMQPGIRVLEVLKSDTTRKKKKKKKTDERRRRRRRRREKKKKKKKKRDERRGRRSRIRKIENGKQ